MFTLASTDTIALVAGAATSITYTLDGMEYSSPNETYKVLANGQAGTSAATVYTVPASTTAFIKVITLINTSAAAVSGVIVYRGGTANSNQITNSLTIPAQGACYITDTSIQMYDQYGNLLTNTSTVVDNYGQSSLTATSAAINTTETIITSDTIPANTLKVGSTYLIMASGTCTSSVANASNIRIRIGTAGNNTDAVAVVITPTAAASGTNIPFFVRLLVTIRSIGSSGTAIGSGVLENNGTTGISAAAVVAAQTTATITVNTTVANTIQLSYVSAATTTTSTFYNAVLSFIKL